MDDSQVSDRFYGFIVGIPVGHKWRIHWLLIDSHDFMVWISGSLLMDDLLVSDIFHVFMVGIQVGHKWRAHLSVNDFMVSLWELRLIIGGGVTEK